MKREEKKERIDMPSISDQQQTSMNRNKIKTTQQTQINSSTKTNQSGRTPSNETTFIDPINQAILVFEKKQRNLGKRKVNFLSLFIFY